MLVGVTRDCKVSAWLAGLADRMLWFELGGLPTWCWSGEGEIGSKFGQTGLLVLVFVFGLIRLVALIDEIVLQNKVTKETGLRRTFNLICRALQSRHLFKVCTVWRLVRGNPSGLLRFNNWKENKQSKHYWWESLRNRFWPFQFFVLFIWLLLCGVLFYDQRSHFVPLHTTYSCPYKNGT